MSGPYSLHSAQAVNPPPVFPLQPIIEKLRNVRLLCPWPLLHHGHQNIGEPLQRFKLRLCKESRHRASDGTDRYRSYLWWTLDGGCRCRRLRRGSRSQR